MLIGVYYDRKLLVLFVNCLSYNSFHSLFFSLCPFLLNRGPRCIISIVYDRKFINT